MKTVYDGSLVDVEFVKNELNDSNDSTQTPHLTRRRCGFSVMWSLCVLQPVHDVGLDDPGLMCCSRESPD